MKRIAFIIATFIYAIGIIAQKPIEIKASETRHGPEKGALVIIGGGEQPDEIWDKIIELAGGKNNARIVIVTNASPDTSKYVVKTIADIKAKVKTKNGVNTLTLNNIREANDENNLQSLREATGVFFVGGRQWRISDVYLNTLAHEEFWNVLNRGGVIAGTSAGASIQASFLWRGDTQSHKINIGDHTQGLGFLRNSVIDQHILARNRQFDVAAFVRIAPQFIGLGIDESTAVVVQRDSLEVIGKSYVAVHSADKENYSFLRKGDKYDLNKHEIHLLNEKDR
ncbi:MAG: cyanophycinase [Candidatus Symbiothrix sp.]|jgi:cyanophycinase|nr:cyanophycinase [Candidatus Symbiothrix sp.]